MRFGILALFAGVLSCQTATQITVKLRGVGVACPSGDSPTIEQTGVLAKRQLQSAADMPKLSVLGEECAAAQDSVVSLGDIVLVPADGPGPVEVLALGALKVGDAPAVSAEDCRAEYERLFGAPCEIGEGKACESCIFARRSVAFVKHSKLEITIDLDASCAGIICDPSQTCAAGGCVSASTDCADDGSCALVDEPKGGAGGEGGAGGAGGEGGGPSGPWFPLWEPPMEKCPNADPSDIVAALIDNGQGVRLNAFVAAGPCMIVLEEGEQPDAVTPTSNGSVNAYRAVAKANDDFIAFGDRGVARRSTSFSALSTSGLGQFSSLVTGVSWDIASVDSPNGLAWARSLQGGVGQVEPFPPGGTQSPMPKPAVFAVFPAATPAQPITFAAFGSVIAAMSGGIGTSSSGNVSTLGWSLWADELPDEPGAFAVVAVGRSTDAVRVGRCFDMASQDVSCPDGFDVVMSPQGPREVVAIWGRLGSAGTDLYAVGQDNGHGPWLGRATLPTTGGPAAATATWAFAGLPEELLSSNPAGVKSVWVGDSGGGVDSVLVVGPGGVFKAHIDDLDFTAGP